MPKRKRIFFETEEVIRKTKRGFIDLETDYFQFYSAAFRFIASLQRSVSKDFILWIMAKVDDNNEFNYNSKMFDDFIADLSQIPTPKTYGIDALNQGLIELREHGLIQRMSRGHYRVNPRMFWSDDVSKRITAIRNIESNSHVEMNNVIGNPPAQLNSNRHEPETTVSKHAFPISPIDEDGVGLPRD